MAPHSSSLAWKIPWTEDPGGLQSMGSLRVGHNWGTSFFHLKSDFDFSFSCIGEGNGNPLQYSCLENPMDRGAWKAAVHGVAKSRTQLRDFTFTFHFPLSCIGEGNGNPLQCSCLENPRDGGAWWAAIYGVTQGRTRMKWRSSSSSSSHLLWHFLAFFISSCLLFYSLRWWTILMKVKFPGPHKLTVSVLIFIF